MSYAMPDPTPIERCGGSGRIPNSEEVQRVLGVEQTAECQGCPDCSTPPQGQVEGERWIYRLADTGACSCVWDYNPDTDCDEVCKPDPECVAHGLIGGLLELVQEWESLPSESLFGDGIRQAATDLRTLLQGQADKGGSDG